MKNGCIDISSAEAFEHDCAEVDSQFTPITDTREVMGQLSKGHWIPALCHIDGENHYGLIVEGTDKVVALTGRVGDGEDAESAANAVLFSAAKDMVKALAQAAFMLEALDMQHGFPNATPIAIQCRRVLARAEI